MVKKVIIFVLLGLVVSCAPSLITKVPVGWARQIFYPSPQERVEACNLGYQNKSEKVLGGFLIKNGINNSNLSFEITLSQSLSGGFRICRDAARANVPIPVPRAGTGSSIVFRTLDTKLKVENLSVVLLGSADQELDELKPTSNSGGGLNPVIFDYFFYDSVTPTSRNLSTTRVENLNAASKFVVKVQVLKNSERHEFKYVIDSLMYSALGEPLQIIR